MIKLTSKPKGWNKWYHPILQYGDEKGHIDFPSATFPSSYLSAKAFMFQTWSSNCDLIVPWGASQDPYSLFATVGGTTGGILGAISGLSAVNKYFNQVTTASWGIGRMETTQSSPPIDIPDVGFCLGDSYKEHCYFAYKSSRDLGSNAWIDVFQRSKLKRMYVAEGIISRFVPDPSFITTSTSVASQYIISLDINGSVPNGVTLTSGNIKIYKKDGATITLTIIKLLSNWDVVVSAPNVSSSASIPQSGDFYKIDPPWCIEDPYMMSGFWKGAQGETLDYLPKSPYKVYKSTHNVFFDNVKFNGAYVYRKKTGEIIPSSYGSVFSETTENEWAWIYYPNVESSIYGKIKDRYFLVDKNDSATTTTTTTTNIKLSLDDTKIAWGKKFSVGQTGDLDTWKGIDGISFVRMEIDKGGTSEKQNWHSPTLAKTWLQQGGKYFQIFAHPLSNVIDVSLKDVLGTTSLDTSNGAGGSILNQYAWMINEHFAAEGTGDPKGFLYGKIKTAAYNSSDGTTSITIASGPTSYGTIARNTSATPYPLGKDNSFYDRFIKSYTPNPSNGSGINFKSLWRKFNNWYVYDDPYPMASTSTSTVMQKSKNYVIVPGTLSINTTPQKVSTPRSGDIPYSAPSPEPGFSAKVYGDMSNSKFAAIYFDIPYDKSYDGLNNIVPYYNYEFGESVPYTSNPLAQGEGGSSLCLDQQYITFPVSVKLPSNTVIGITGGRYWGIGGQAHVLNPNALDFSITTPQGVAGISSFYSELPEQDWVFYKDNYTDRVTLRLGSLNFLDCPRRSEIAIGLTIDGSGAGSFPITLDSSKERVRFVSLSLPSSSGSGNGSPTNVTPTTDAFSPCAITFQIGNTSDYYGFPSTGSGSFDFQALRYNGYAEGSVDFSKYKYKENFASPVYVYTQREDRAPLHNTEILELGVATSEKTINAKNGSVTATKIEYIKDNQTLLNIGFFDAHLCGGETILIYGKNTNSFDFSGKSINPETWKTNEAIYAIGSTNNAFLWGTPVAGDLKYNGDANYQYPVLLFNSCNYITSVYNDLSESLIIFATCYIDNGSKYIGVFIISRLSLMDGLSICNSTISPPDQSFWVRKNKIPSIVTDSYAESSIILSSNTSGENVTDNFIRVMGPIETNSQVVLSIDNVGDITSAILPNGTIVMFYKEANNIRMISSRNSFAWIKSEIILAKNASSALLVNNMLFYITPEGIASKNNVLEYIDEASLITKIAGSSTSDIESIQSKFDDINECKVELIGSGPIPEQRLSGYMDENGVYKIFYYNNNMLCCLQKHNVWKMANNF